MRALLPLSLACLASLSLANTEPHEQPLPNDPAAHHHGAARLDLAMDDTTLLMALHSPAINLTGFEHQPGTDAERATLAAVKAHLHQPLELFAIPEAAGCIVEIKRLESPLLEFPEGFLLHSNVNAEYRLACDTLTAFERLDLATFFNAFPRVETLEVRALTSAGQAAGELNAANPGLDLPH